MAYKYMIQNKSEGTLFAHKATIEHLQHFKQFHYHQSNWVCARAHPWRALAHNIRSNALNSTFKGCSLLFYEVLKPWMRRRAQNLKGFVSQTAFTIDCSIDASTNDVKILGGVLTSQPLPQEIQTLDLDLIELAICINKIKAMLSWLDNGSIKVSVLDTAWIARVPTIDGLRSNPRFPTSIQWILDNQQDDGSWDDHNSSFAHERVCSTLACVITLRTWMVGEKNVEKGLMFIRWHVSKMETKKNYYEAQYAFVLVLPAMLDEAKMLGMDICYDAPIVKLLKSKREEHLKRIPLNKIYNYPMIVVHCIQGLHHVVDWEKLMMLQVENGSLLNSPVLTACALIHTGNSNCYKYLHAVLEEFGNAVPSVYPLSFLERLAIIYELQCLGVSRYFNLEIANTFEHACRNWDTYGLVRHSQRALLETATQVVSGVRSKEEEADEKMADMSSELDNVVKLFILIDYPFEGAQHLQRLFQKQNGGFHENLLLKTSKLLRMEVEAKIPWYATLIRLETRHFIEDYGKDLWIRKGRRAMKHHINNDTLLRMAKMDFNLCQSIHQTELDQIIRWSHECQISALKFPRHRVTVNYFSVAAMIFEPDMAPVRLVWTRCCALATVLDDFFDYAGSICEFRAFLKAFKRWEPALSGCFSKECQILYKALYDTITDIAREGFIAQDHDVCIDLRKIWERWLSSCLIEAEWKDGGYNPSMEDYMKVATRSIALEPIVLSSMLFLGEKLTKDLFETKDFAVLMNLVNISGRLLNDIRSYKREVRQGKLCSVTIYVKEHPEVTEEQAVKEIETTIQTTMMELVREVLRPSVLPKCCKNLLLCTARIVHFFYKDIDGYSSSNAMKDFVEEILFNKIE